MQLSKQAGTYTKLSLLSTVITVLLATITHAYIFGYRAFVAGFAFIFLLTLLNIYYQRKKNTLSLLFISILNVIVVVGFGLINGFWNHTLKVALTYLHGGHLPPVFTGLFQNPAMGTFFEEGIGILTFITSIFSAYYAFKLVRTAKTGNKIQTQK